ncbi:2-oxoglutarate (2OG) and Fe(II)-dependent oxygenase superfamily protein [Thalictrum thalictroides]|uniref:2-oxoglutarate (2OG) and Fe(II)-dependent oxygenase superfamily protein n=1 Tax=Thalictrum thalictroides TaxID=46969 RepID=A0A7J6WLR5_THATH|nr:2-oxoglutarate (2OG) and Fe(II)-dependent oxygenase superfamily protein [Thalictrum thalictroides]
MLWIDYKFYTIACEDSDHCNHLLDRTGLLISCSFFRSVLVLNGNGADVAKHCVPAVLTKRISITFRKMDETKRPFVFVPEPDLQGLQPLPYDVGESKSMNPPAQMNRQPVFREVNSENSKAFSGRGSRSEPRYSGRTRLQPGNRRRTRE